MPKQPGSIFTLDYLGLEGEALQPVLAKLAEISQEDEEVANAIVYTLEVTKTLKATESAGVYTLDDQRFILWLMQEMVANPQYILLLSRIFNIKVPFPGLTLDGEIVELFRLNLDRVKSLFNIKEALFMIYDEEEYLEILSNVRIFTSIPLLTGDQDLKDIEEWGWNLIGFMKAGYQEVIVEFFQKYGMGSFSMQKFDEVVVKALEYDHNPNPQERTQMTADQLRIQLGLQTHTEES